MPSGPPLRLVRHAYPDPPWRDTAVSRAILLEVGKGGAPDTLRLHRPPAVVAFGRRDVVAPGYRKAVTAARRHGFEGVERLAGGRAAVFHPGTLAFAWAVADREPRQGIEQRFELLAGIVQSALRSLGVDALIGEVAGEYCPGRYSVNAGGRRKLMGVGQRLTAGAAHVGGVVVIEDSARVRSVLEPVYEALDITWDPATVGAVAEELDGLDCDRVEEALLEAFAARYQLTPSLLGEETLELADRLAPEHRSPL